MFRFEHPYYLYVLLIIPIMILGQVVFEIWRKKRFSAQINPELRVQINSKWSGTKIWIKLSIYSLALSLVVIGIANPQSGSKMEEVKRQGVDIMIALDISNSMLAEDLYPNRLGRAKRSIQELFKYLKSDRIGIVVFAGESFVQLPITTDYSAAKLFLNSIETDLITTQGTDIGNAIDLCLKSFDPESATSKSIILISDGENHEETSSSALQAAKEQGVIVHTIGMGSVDGSPIPIYKSGSRIGFRTNRKGNTVVSKLNEEMLNSLAQSTGGMFVRASNAQSGMSYIFDEVEKMEKVDFGSKIYTDYEDRFQFFLFPALILLIIELIIPNTRSLWWEKLFASQS
jgi:Ca-activated chloride channel family protein